MKLMSLDVGKGSWLALCCLYFRDATGALGRIGIFATRRIMAKTQYRAVSISRLLSYNQSLLYCYVNSICRYLFSKKSLSYSLKYSFIVSKLWLSSGLLGGGSPNRALILDLGTSRPTMG